MIDSRDVTVAGYRVRVVVTPEEEFIRDPRDEWPNASDVDVVRWLDQAWRFVTVTVTLLHGCSDCRAEHATPHTDSLGMCALGDGDGWSTTIDDLVTEYPVPDMVAELIKGRSHDDTH